MEVVRTSYRKPLDYGMKASQLKTSGPTLKSEVNVNLHVTRKKVPQLFGEHSFSVLKLCLFFLKKDMNQVKIVSSWNAKKKSQKFTEKV